MNPITNPNPHLSHCDTCQYYTVFAQHNVVRKYIFVSHTTKELDAKYEQ
jgi:hypothetical protein